jgi:hypothetical protein
MRPRITLRIGRVVSDRPLDRKALAEALRIELEALVTAQGPGALGPGRALTQLRGGRVAAPAEPGGAARAVARATLGALRR